MEPITQREPVALCRFSLPSGHDVVVVRDLDGTSALVHGRTVFVEDRGSRARNIRAARTALRLTKS